MTPTSVEQDPFIVDMTSYNTRNLLNQFLTGLFRQRIMLDPADLTHRGQVRYRQSIDPSTLGIYGRFIASMTLEVIIHPVNQEGLSYVSVGLDYNHGDLKGTGGSNGVMVYQPIFFNLTTRDFTFG